MMSHIWNLKYDIDEAIYDTERLTAIRNRLVVAKEQGGWEREGLGVSDQQMQTSVYRMDKQQGPLHSTGNYIQYPMMNHNGK